MSLSIRTMRSLLTIAFLVSVGVFHGESIRAEEAVLPIPDFPTSISLSWNGGSRIVSGETIFSWFYAKNNERFGRNSKTEAISPHFCPWKLFFCEFSLTEDLRYSQKTVTDFSLNEAALLNFMENLRKETRTDPLDAIFSVNADGSVSAFAPSRDGVELNIESSMRILKNSLESLPQSREKEISVNLPTTVVAPRITSTDADRLGITKFLGEGRTNFSGSPKNRIFNIKRALEQFQGVLIAPGEEFSFVEKLGAVDGEHGYLPELVIKRGETLPEFGGGICQVSTTLFRAALNTGQKITERRNHAYPVQYYKPYGMDATVYIPKPDFRFRNNTPAHLLIQGAIEGKELVFRFYGTPDGRKIEIDGPHITARTPDGGMKTIFTQKVFTADGNPFIEDVFKSSYESPSKYPHPGEEKLTEKPANWSEKQWRAYVETGALPR